MGITCPFTIIIDTREQNPWSFDGITKNKQGQQVAVHIPTVRRKLDAGDYSIDGMEQLVAIERKTCEDLISTIAHNRERFIRELQKLAEMKFACVIVEGSSWEDTLSHCRILTAYNPVSLDSSILSFMIKYGVHFLWRPSRFAAHKTAYKLFDLIVRRSGWISKS